METPSGFLPCRMEISDLYHPNRDQRRWVLTARSGRETEVDVIASRTARNEDIAGNPHRPKGFGRNGIAFVVVSSSECRNIFSSLTPRIQRRLARTLLPIRVVQATRITDRTFQLRAFISMGSTLGRTVPR